MDSKGTQVDSQIVSLTEESKPRSRNKVRTGFGITKKIEHSLTVMLILGILSVLAVA